MPTSPTPKVTTFYQELQQSQTLDLRDNRGKRHELAFVLIGLIIALLRKRDGNLSSIHRSMVNTHHQVCEVLSLDIPKPISRAHLPRMLRKVNLDTFQTLLIKKYGITLSEQEKDWFSVDGKELRGSIVKGQKRGAVLVHIVRHQDQSTLAQTYFDGSKESEKVVVKDLLKETEVLGQKITADALHLHKGVTEPIAQKRGEYLIGLKENQKELYADMHHHSHCHRPLAVFRTVEKAHGRLEERNYVQYDVSEAYFDARWLSSDFKRLYKIERCREELKDGKKSYQVSYYLSNGISSEAEAYFQAIRNHWSIESLHYERDMSLQEDKFRTKKRRLLS